MILQLKTGSLDRSYFLKKFNADILDVFKSEFAQLAEAGRLAVGETGVTLTRDGLLQADRLLPAFFDPAYRGTRYT